MSVDQLLAFALIVWGLVALAGLVWLLEVWVDLRDDRYDRQDERVAGPPVLRVVGGPFDQDRETA